MKFQLIQCHSQSYTNMIMWLGFGAPCCIYLPTAELKCMCFGGAVLVGSTASVEGWEVEEELQWHFSSCVDRLPTIRTHIHHPLPAFLQQLVIHSQADLKLLNYSYSALLVYDLVIIAHSATEDKSFCVHWLARGSRSTFAGKSNYSQETKKQNKKRRLPLHIF